MERLGNGNVMADQAALIAAEWRRGSFAAVLVATTGMLIERLRAEQKRPVSQSAAAHDRHEQKNSSFCEASHHYWIWMLEVIRKDSGARDLHPEVFRQLFADLGGQAIMHTASTQTRHVHNCHRRRSGHRYNQPDQG